MLFAEPNSRPTSAKPEEEISQSEKVKVDEPPVEYKPGVKESLEETLDEKPEAEGRELL